MNEVFDYNIYPIIKSIIKRQSKADEIIYNRSIEILNKFGVTTISEMTNENI